MLNQEVGQPNVPRRVARPRGHRAKHECRSCKSVGRVVAVPRSALEGARPLETPGLLLCCFARDLDVRSAFLN